ncbi:alkanesulfonate monooxygenase SsuD/methylene tetrahydromethanopterin reductase-like flavin-dependent oxidoreductase (luciferase family) [Prauserella shujinwangii]|uniref:Alkanesulfonate monooxygenase SsuD/methylene tetrahydromethanopterin reductase-like flavin-dependent oxidoreductase (Luciferase family) n=1 Tax=Prauserella shujinwangii TaxID=1453103 RepID=A0A2T0LZ04_9PSEU|nr:LLM class flavin-dependent oxidoreductase [Prauserella shujinwangii]PRX49348.1 alkanesulfonate monooxygenase SsuD/methylene tetrahydromethanopterin reductase-like flavin-dependent oxidoreductase (luciferase family) [Prauserella shujinwangii]
MRFGIFVLAGRFPGQDDEQALTRSLDAVVRAEEAGFDDAWIAEHHFMSYGVCPSAITFAAHALGRTSRITLGTAVSVLSTVHPVALAEQAALLDRISGGRFRLGVGRGGPWVDLEVFGTGLPRYEHGFAESLDLLLDCLRRDHVSADGEHFAFREVPMVPRPADGQPPVTVACTSRATVEQAAARGLPMLLGMHAGDDEKAGLVEHYARAATEAGRDPRGVPHVAAVLAQVGEDRRHAEHQLRAAMPGWLADGLRGYVPVDGRPYTPRDPVAYTDLLCSLHPVGSPADCAGRLRESIDRTGIEHVVMLVEGGGTRERTLANIDRLGTEVLPLLRDA